MRNFLQKNSLIIGVVAALITITSLVTAMSTALKYEPPTGKEIVYKPATEEDSFADDKEKKSTPPQKKEPKDILVPLFIGVGIFFFLVSTSVFILLLRSQKETRPKPAPRSVRKENLDKIRGSLHVFYKLYDHYPQPDSEDFSRAIKTISPPLDFDWKIYRYENPGGDTQHFLLSCELEEDFSSQTGEKNYVLQN